MKKTLILFVLLVLVLIISVSANFKPEWRFDDANDRIDWTSGIYCQTVATSENGMTLTPTDIDPQIMVVLKPSQRFEAAKYKYIAFRMKVTGTSTIATLFFTTDKNPALDGSHISKAITADGQWHDYIVDMTGNRWSSTVTSIRLDTVNNNPMGSVTTIDRIGVFETQYDARAFCAEQLGSNYIKPAHTWDFKNSADVSAWTASGCGFQFVEGVGKVSVTSSDPTIKRTMTQGEIFNAAQYPIVAYRCKTSTTATIGGFFFTTSNLTTLSDASYSPFTLKNDGEWHNYIIDMSSYAHGKWTGDVNLFRLDPINATHIGAVIYIDKLGFFQNTADANNFLRKDIAGKAEQTNLTWDFTDPDQAGEWAYSECPPKYTNGAYRIVVKTWDPVIYIQLSDTNAFNANEYKYIALKSATKTNTAQGGFFFTTDTIPVFSDATFSTFALDKTGAWKDYVIDMTSYPHANWKGKITKLRLDPINFSSASPESSALIYIDRIGVFKTSAEAQAFLNASTPAPIDTEGVALSFKTNSQKTFFPANEIPGALNETSYYLSSANVEGTKSYPAQIPVVYRTYNAVQTIMPASYVNPQNYASFVAKCDGTYTMKYNNKTFADIEAHSAKNNILFTAEREIMAGIDSTNFSPDTPMTRKMFATALAKFAMSTSSASIALTDVTSSDESAKYIYWVLENGIMSATNNCFYPDTAITRVDAGKAIKKYLSLAKYEFEDIGQKFDLSEISYLTMLEQKALQDLAYLGIFEGISDISFAQGSVFTRAQAATIFANLAKRILGLPAKNYNHTAAYISRDRIKIGSWGNFNSSAFNQDYMENYVNGGFNWLLSLSGVDKEYMLQLSDKYGVENYVHDGAYNSANYALMNEYYHHPSFNGHYITDEPGTDSYDALAVDANAYYRYTGGKIPFINLLPMYANAAQLKYGAGYSTEPYYDNNPNIYRNYCQSFVTKFDAPYICTDIYPLNWSAGKKTTYGDYCESINQIAKVARDTNKEFWCFIQTFSWTPSKRTPNEAEFRWQCYSMLSFGCTGILCWTYSGYQEDFPSLVDIDSNNTQSFYDARNAFREINAISDVFVQYRNLGVGNHNYSSTYPYLYVSDLYTGFTPITQVSCPDPLLFGYFEKKTGTGKAFTIVNMSEFQAQKTVTVNLKITGNLITCYQKGVPTVLTPSNGYYTFTLATGEGVFVTIS